MKKNLFLLLLFFSCMQPVLAEDSMKAAEISKVRVPFITNCGQVDEKVAFYAETFAGTVFVTRDGKIVYAFQSCALEESLVHGKTAKIRGKDKAQTRINHFKGSDPVKWRRGIDAFESVDLGEVFDGIELRLVAHGNNVEKIFILQPNARPHDIRIRMLGSRGLLVNESGILEVKTDLGEVSFTKPTAYQEESGVKKSIDVAYWAEGNEYGFQVSDYDHTKPLVIDPLLASTFLGGTSDEGQWGCPNMSLDKEGNVYIAGYTNSANFPTTAGAYNETKNGGFDACVTKMDSHLSTVIASTFLGGSAKEWGWRGVNLWLDTDENVYVTGQTQSSDFPVTQGAYDETYNGSDDIFISKLSGDLSQLLASTYHGSPGYELPNALVMDDKGRLFLGGQTTSTAFPVTPGAFDTTYGGSGQPWGGDIFISRFDSDLTILEASTYLGGTDLEFGGFLTVTKDGNLYVSGTTGSLDFPSTPGAYCEKHMPKQGGYGCDAFITMMDNGLSKVLSSTFLGGSLDDWGYCPVAIDGEENVYITGHVSSTDYPVTSGAYDTTYNGKPGIDAGDDFPVSKLDKDLTMLIASTYVGGYEWEGGLSLKLADDGSVYVSGYTFSTDFPTTPGAYAPAFNGGERDAVIFRLDEDLTTLQRSTYLGGNHNDRLYSMILDPDGNVYVSGITRSKNFPVTPGAFDRTFNGGTTYSGDIFLSRFDAELSADTLTGDADEISAALGGTVNFHLVAGSNNANRGYLLLGSVSGVLPGMPLPGGTTILPLNWDTFTELAIAHANTPVFQNFMGSLDGSGNGLSALNLGPLPSSVAGTKMYFAYTLGKPFDFVSNPVRVKIVP
jgi:hypothetical protein